MCERNSLQSLFNRTKLNNANKTIIRYTHFNGEYTNLQYVRVFSHFYFGILLNRPPSLIPTDFTLITFRNAEFDSVYWITILLHFLQAHDTEIVFKFPITQMSRLIHGTQWTSTPTFKNEIKILYCGLNVDFQIRNPHSIALS